MSTHAQPAGAHAGDTADLRIHVGDLLARPGLSRALRREARAEGFATSAGRVDPADPLELDLRLDAIPEGIVVSGHVSGAWSAECSRCLEPVHGVFSAEIRELYEARPVEGETYPIEGDELDLTPVLRDAVLPQIPVVPLCDDACLGLCPVCGVDRNVETCGCSQNVPDHRWDALAQIRFSDTDRGSDSDSGSGSDSSPN